MTSETITVNPAADSEEQTMTSQDGTATPLATDEQDAPTSPYSPGRRKPALHKPHPQPTTLTPLATEILRAIVQHRLLNTDHVTALFPDYSRFWITDNLRFLRQQDLIGYVRPKVSNKVSNRGKKGRVNLPFVYFATRTGVQAVASDPESDGLRIVTLTQRQVTANTQPHTLAVNTAVIALTHHARAQGGKVEWAREVSHRVKIAPGSRSQYANADAVATMEWERDGVYVTLRLIVEVDRDTKSLDSIRAQLQAYVDYFQRQEKNKPAWHGQYLPDARQARGGFPALVWVFEAATPEESEKRLRRFAQVAQDLLPSPPESGGEPPMWCVLTTSQKLAAEVHHGAPKSITDPVFVHVHGGSTLNYLGGDELPWGPIARA